MKKISLLFSFLLLAMAPAQAQLTINKNGQVVFGKRMAQNPFNPPLIQTAQEQQKAVVVTPSYVPIDSLATSVFLGNKSDNSGAYITFGGHRNVWIGEKNNNGTVTPYVMQLGFTDGIEGKCRRGTVFSLTTTRTNNSGPFTFLILSGENVVISNEFSVELGGVLQINT